MIEPNKLGQNSVEGILLVDKPKGQTSFSLVSVLRKRLNVKKIGHAGTLDPFATGVMVLLIGRNYTRLSDSFLDKDKEYIAQVYLGIATDTYDCEGSEQFKSDYVPSIEEVEKAVGFFQGEIKQTPPMYSAKKVQGKKLYELARKGIEVERAPVTIQVQTELLNYAYPHLTLRIRCSKGTYIRSIGHDLGKLLTCGAHLTNLQRTKSGSFRIEDCLDGSLLKDQATDVEGKIVKLPTE